MAIAKKNWRNVYALRQEFHPFQKRWVPVIVFWNHDKGSFPESWLECLMYDAGGTCYSEIDYSVYATRTHKGTDKCDKEDVVNILARYLHDCKDDGQPLATEVQKIGAYRP